MNEVDCWWSSLPLCGSLVGTRVPAWSKSASLTWKKLIQGWKQNQAFLHFWYDFYWAFTRKVCVIPVIIFCCLENPFSTWDIKGWRWEARGGGMKVWRVWSPHQLFAQGWGSTWTRVLIHDVERRRGRGLEQETERHVVEQRLGLVRCFVEGRGWGGGMGKEVHNCSMAFFVMINFVVQLLDNVH